MPDYIKLRGTAPMKTQRLLRQIHTGREQVKTIYRDKRTLYASFGGDGAPVTAVALGTIRKEDDEFLHDLHTYAPNRLRITGGGLVLHSDADQKMREVGDWLDLTDTEMQLVLEGVYYLIPKLHGVNIDL